MKSTLKRRESEQIRNATVEALKLFSWLLIHFSLSSYTRASFTLIFEVHNHLLFVVFCNPMQLFISFTGHHSIDYFSSYTSIHNFYWLQFA